MHIPGTGYLRDLFRRTLDPALKTLSISKVSFQRPIFIWGLPRSGTYLLYDVLSLSPEMTFCGTKDYRMKKGIWGDMNYGDQTPSALAGFAKPVEGLSAMWMSAGVGDGIIDESQLKNLQMDRRKILTNYASLKRALPFKEIGRKYRILDKAPQYLMLADQIDYAFPDALHIFCIRDPRLVANSCLRLIRFPKNGVVPWKSGYLGNMRVNNTTSWTERPLVETMCHQIAELVEHCLDNQRTRRDRIFKVHYENLRDDFPTQVRNLVNALDLKWPKELFDVLPERFPSYDPEWPGINGTFDETFEIAFSMDEKPYLDKLSEVAVQLGYDSQAVGRVVSGVQDMKGRSDRE